MIVSGNGAGPMVTIFAFHSDEACSNPAESQNTRLFVSKILNLVNMVVVQLLSPVFSH